MTRLAEIAIWIIIATLVALRAVPGSTWYDVGSPIRVHAETDYHISFNGGPTRPFLGSYKVSVRSAVTRKVVVEGPYSGKFPYRPGSHRPEPPSLEWWVGSDEAAAKIRGLPPGDYIADTCWTVHDPFYAIILSALGVTPYQKDGDPQFGQDFPVREAIAATVASIAGERDLCNRSLTFTITPPP